jgi:tetratricopeptide (TPR) repeat protein
MSRALPVVLAIVLLTACSRAPELEPVTLPDLSKMDPSVQTQLRQRHGAAQTLQRDRLPDEDIGYAFGELGKMLLAAEQYDAAAASFRNAERLMPQDARWPHYLGHAYAEQSDPARAAASFERAATLDRANAAALIRAADAYLASERLDDAERVLGRVLAQALAREPPSAAAASRLGRVALARRDYPRAVTMFEQALAAEPRASSVHYQLALAYRGLGDAAKADAHLRQRGDVEPDPPDPLMASVESLIESLPVHEAHGVEALGRGDWPAAVEHFRKGVAMAPDTPSIRHQLGTALFMAGDHAGAREQFEEVVRRSPAFARARLSLGVLLESNGERDRAIEHLRAAVEHDPTYAEAHLRLAQVLRQSGRVAEARSHFRTTLALDPDNGEALAAMRELQ